VAERMYPGLGTPIETGLPFDVGPGTRQAGMDVLRRQMAPAPGALPSGMLGPLMDIWRYGSILGPNLQQKMAEQRDKMAQDYYSVPSTPGPGVPSLADVAYNTAAIRSDNRLGPSASGRAEPALLTDEMVANYMGARVGGGMFPWIYRKTMQKPPDDLVVGGPPGPKDYSGSGGYPSFAMTPGNVGPKTTSSHALGEERRANKEPTLESQVPVSEDRSIGHVIQQFLPTAYTPIPNYQGWDPNVVRPDQLTPFAF
jgi:hypothetical protein